MIEDIFLVYKDGRLISHNTRRLKPDSDDNVLASMFTAVQEFIKDPLAEDETVQINEISYGQNKILIEHGKHLFMAAVVSGMGTRAMHGQMRASVQSIERDCARVLEKWSGNAREFRESKKWIKALLEEDYQIDVDRRGEDAGSVKTASVEVRDRESGKEAGVDRKEEPKSEEVEKKEETKRIKEKESSDQEESSKDQEESSKDQEESSKDQEESSEDQEESSEDEENGRETGEHRKKKKEPRRKAAWGIIKDILISAAIVGGLLLVLYIYSGVWPPMVVIESSSMQHGPDSQIGVIDTGDLTLVKKVSDRSEIITYVEATCRTNPNYGFKEYGDFGSVIVYKKNGKYETPVIHRAIAWIEYNASASDPGRRYFRGDIPDIGVYNVSEYYVNVTSYRTENYLKQEVLVIQISAILAATTTSPIPHSGFVTKGDHNPPYVDQWVLYVQGGVRVELVKMEWIVGKAQGELPWFGLFKLWITGHKSDGFPKTSVNGLIATVIILIVVPIIIDYLYTRWKKKRTTRKDARRKEGDSRLR